MFIGNGRDLFVAMDRCTCYSLTTPDKVLIDCLTDAEVSSGIAFEATLGFITPPR
jgi:hypothetical protein